MNTSTQPNVCPVEYSGGLDNSLRKLLQNPRKLLGKYITEEMTILDLGCGPGFFSIELAKMLNDKGQVIAADLQQGMLDKVHRKVAGTILERKITLHRCQADRIGLNEQADFILAFYMVHELPDQERLFRELKTLLKPKGTILIVEPKFHVTGKAFEAMLLRIRKAGFEATEVSGFTFSRAVKIMHPTV